MSDKREVVRFFSVRQIEEFFAPRLEGMFTSEIREWIESYCEFHKVRCGAYEYAAGDLVQLLIS